jgi:amidohydrolase
MPENLIELRHYLHKYPDLPKEEAATAQYIEKLLAATSPDDMWTKVGGKGIVAFYKGKNPGKTIAVRAELDGLPIKESNSFEYASRNEGRAHSCGHDGHMTIVFGLAEQVAKLRDNLHGTVVIIFQPEEETGTGAAKMLADERMQNLHLDYVLALHNLPGFEKHSVIIRKGTFTSTTTGMVVRLWGATSHAGHPENGNTPVMAMTAIINSLNSLPQLCVPVYRPALVTIIHAQLGEVAFGTTPGYAHVMATMRAHEAKDLESMKKSATLLVSGLAKAHDLRYELEWVEYYAAMINDEMVAAKVVESANDLNLPIVQRDYPFSWSEDFSFFAQKYPGALFGLGSGVDHPQLHNDDYDFPDELIDTGIKMFSKLIEKLSR